MSLQDRALHEAPRRKRPSIFWWTLAHLLALAFAALAWTTCLYVFNYPEKPQNYELLRKIGRLTPVTAFEPLKAPEGTPAGPEVLYKKFFPRSDEDLARLNLQFRRGYIRNFKKTDPRLLIYVEGDFIVESSRLLNEGDFFSPGLLVRAQAQVAADDFSNPTPYPVHLALALPFAETPDGETFAAGKPLTLKHLGHRAAVFRVAQTTVGDEPGVLVTAVPLSYPNYRAPDGSSLPLAPPDELNLDGGFHPEEEPAE